MDRTCPACSADVVGAGPCEHCGASAPSSAPTPDVVSSATLPAQALGFVKVDFDPAAGQKVAAYRLAQQFPDSGVRGEDSLRDDLLGALLDGEDQAQYDAHVRPWLGARAGVAWLPPSAADPSTPRYVVALQVEDRDAAQDGLTALLAETAEGDELLRWEFSPGGEYVLLSDEQSAVDLAVSSTGSLADDERFAEGVAALDGDQVALGWLDVGGVWRALPEADREQALREVPGLAPEGTVVVGTHLDDDGVEVVGRSLGVSAGDAPELQALLDSPLGRTAPTGLVERLPADSALAVGLTGLGEGFSRLWTTFADDPTETEEVRAQLDAYGVRLPEDAEVLLGSELAVGVGGALADGAPRVDLQVRTADPDRAVELLELAREAASAAGATAADEVELQQVEGGYALHYPAGSPSGAGDLGSSEVFDRTVPDAGDSGVTYFLSVPAVLESFVSSGWLTERQRRNLEPIRGVGYTASLEDGGDAVLRLRMTVD